MSRHLPPHPNLDHLRKQAKDLLHDLRQRDPASKLADAQHTIARAYGFTSWPKLKAHVESVAPADSQRVAGPGDRHPFAGTWTANVLKSRRHPANPFQSATLQFDVAGDTVTIANVVVNAAGRKDHGRHTIRVDGVEHPSEHGNGYGLMARWRGSRVLETSARKDGRIVGQGMYEVSADGRTLTISGDEQVIVLDRA